jgi:hypothetical protein
VENLWMSGAKAVDESPRKNFLEHDPEESDADRTPRQTFVIRFA